MLEKIRNVLAELRRNYRETASLQQRQLDATDRLMHEVVNTLRHENRILTTLLRFQALPNKTCEFYHKGQKFCLYIPEGDTDLVQNQIIMHKNFYEFEMLERLENHADLKGADVLDAGANIGSHTVYFVGACGANSCISFEPNPQVSEVLERNIGLNSLGDKVTIHKEGLSDGSGFIYFRDHDNANIGGTSFTDKADGLGFPCRTIDSLELRSLHFIKMDVEGMADRVLKGAADTISQHKPLIMIELFPHEFSAANAVLKSYGYSKTADLDDGYNFVFSAR